MAGRNLNPYEELGNAVVLQAVKDYRDAVKKLSRGKVNHAAEQMKAECERFFKSSYFNLFKRKLLFLIFEIFFNFPS